MLTDKAIKAAKPKPDAYKLSDQGGLYLFVTPNGARSWRYDFRLARQRKTFTIGLYPDVSLADARGHHAEAHKLVAAGKCPVLTKRRARQAAALGVENTVEAIWKVWFAGLAPHKSEAWRKGEQGRFDNYIVSKLGHLPIAEVEPSDVLALVKDVAQQYPKTAELVRHTLTRVFSLAIQNLLCKGNPAREIQGAIVVPPVKHHRPIAKKDVPAFIEKLDGYPGRLQTKLAAKLLLLTMVRKRELTDAVWDEFDFDAEVWTIPPERMKRGTGHVVPLSRQAVESFKELKPLACGSKYVFPKFGDPRKPMSHTTLNLAFERMGLTVAPHALRSTASTILNEENKFRPDVIERQLSHIERNRVRASYNQAEYIDERRDMLQWWADFIDRPANVVPMRGRAAHAAG